MRRALVAVSLAVALAPALRADLYERARGRLEVYDERDGLPQNLVQRVALGPDGRLWIGTQDGAAVFDGRTWRTVPMPNRTASNHVRAILAASDGSLWFGTEGGGVCRLASGGGLPSWGDEPDEGAGAAPLSGDWQVLDTRSGLPSDQVASLLETREADGLVVWAGTSGGGLGRYARGRWARIGKQHGLPSEKVYALLETRDPSGGRLLWVGTTAGLAYRRPDGPAESAWQVIDVAAGLPDPVVNAIHASIEEDGSRSLWLGTNGGLVRLALDGPAPRVAQVVRLADGLPNESVWDVAETREADGSRVLWVGTRQGVARLHRGRVSTLDARSGLPVDRVFCLLAAQAERQPATVWIGTAGGGLVRLRPSGWRFLGVESGLPSPLVSSVAFVPSASGRPETWIGTLGGGVARADAEGRLETLKEPEGLPGNAVWCLAPGEDEAGRAVVWAGTARNGLAVYRSGRFEPYPPKGSEPLPSSSIWSLLPARGPGGAPVLWVGTNGAGIARVEGGSVTVIGKEQGLPNDGVLCLLQTEEEDGGTDLWAGTESGGLSRVRDGKVAEVIGVAQGLAHQTVFSLHLSRDAKGRRTLWAGTAGGVSYRSLDEKGARWSVLTDSTRPALSNNLVYAIEEDARRRLYLLTSRGITRLTPGPESPAAYTAEVFLREDGLPSQEGIRGALRRDPWGRVWAGTVGGLAVLDPAAEIADTQRKRLVFESVLVGDHLVPGPPSALQIPHDGNRLRVEWALLSYYRETDTRYRSQLVGFDELPSRWSAEGRREYTNLPAGSYVFRVVGRDHAGNQSDPLELAVRVRPAPWQTWWAWAAYAGLLGLAVALVIRLRVRSLARRNAELAARVEERTRELSQTVENLTRSETRLKERTDQLAETVFQMQVSEARAVESERRALAASQAKSGFLANMSHELRTPLNAIIGYAEILEEEVGDRKTVLADVQKIHGAGRHLLSLINDVLDLSKIEAGRMELLSDRVDLAALVCAVVQTVEPLVARNANRLVSDLAPDLGIVLTDGTRLKQVLFNLLSNAAKFTDAGTITLSVSRPAEPPAGAAGEGHVPLRSEVRWILIRVTDTGIGMTPEQLAKIFQPFVQASNRISKKYGGTGIGLAISRRLCQMMGGDLTVESSPGKGTTFTACVPARSAPPEAQDPGAGTTRPAIAP